VAVDIAIRPEVPDDAAGIRTLLAGCFPTDAEAHLVDLLRDAGHLTVSLVALAGDAVVGHVAFSPVSASTGEQGLGLAPVATDSRFRRQGVAARLIRAGFGRCLAEGCGWVVVLGDPAYYRRFGFRPAAELGLCDEYGGGAAFQVLELVEGAAPRSAGLVRYGQEFASV